MIKNRSNEILVVKKLLNYIKNDYIFELLDHEGDFSYEKNYHIP